MEGDRVGLGSATETFSKLAVTAAVYHACWNSSRATRLFFMLLEPCVGESISASMG